MNYNEVSLKIMVYERQTVQQNSTSELSLQRRGIAEYITASFVSGRPTFFLRGWNGRRGLKQGAARGKISTWAVTFGSIAMIL